MMPMEDVQEPLHEEDSVNQEESQSSRNNDIEEGPENSVRQEEENPEELEEIEESVSQNEEASHEAEPREEAGSGGSSCDSRNTVILLPQGKKRRSFEIPHQVKMKKRKNSLRGGG